MMLRLYVLACILAVVALMVLDPVKGFGIVAFFALIFGIPIFLSKGSSDQERK